MTESPFLFFLGVSLRAALAAGIFAAAFGVLDSGIKARRKPPPVSAFPRGAAPSRPTGAAAATCVREARSSGYWRDKLVLRSRRLASGALHLATGERPGARFDGPATVVAAEDPELADFLAEEHMVPVPGSRRGRRRDPDFASRLERALDGIERIAGGRADARSPETKGGTSE